MEYVIEGARIKSLDDFYEEISRALIPGQGQVQNLDSLDDLLRGGFGTPEGGFVLRWRDSELSRAALGYVETVRQLELCLAQCHPSGQQDLGRRLSLARLGQGATVFDWLVEIICDHAPGARQTGNVRLLLD